jgi:hypothetical protein
MLGHDLKQRHPDTPGPVAKLKAGFVWDYQDVEKWTKKIGRLK